MAFQPKTKPGPSAGFTSTTHKNYEQMTISELVLFLRTAYREEDFDKVEEELVNRDAKLKAHIASLHEKIQEERLVRTEAQEKLKRTEEQCEKGKRTKDNYENLLKEVKKNGLLHENTSEELRKKNIALERELKELKKKWVDDANAVAEFRIKIAVLEEERVGDKNDLDALRMKNNELEEAVKKGLKIKEELWTENCKLADEKRQRGELVESMERKFGELSVRVVKLEDDTKLLMSVNASGCGNTEVEPDVGVTFAVKDEEDFGGYEHENDTGGHDHVPLQRSIDTRHSLGAATGRSPSIGYKDALGASGMGFGNGNSAFTSYSFTDLQYCNAPLEILANGAYSWVDPEVLKVSSVLTTSGSLLGMATAIC
ncbi:hypothetical protein CR513_27455, partial [Mucuna pruriens]